MRLVVSMPLLLCALALPQAVGPARAEMAGAEPSLSCKTGSAPMARLELLFGMSRHGGEPINDQEWQGFVDQEVTPRFPDGLTVVQAYGQWRNQAGRITKEAGIGDARRRAFLRLVLRIKRGKPDDP
jgi:hypothetical protein